MGSTPATFRYKVRLYRINTHEVTIYSAGSLGKAEVVVLAITELHITFLHNCLSDFRSEGRTLLDLAPATRLYKERHCRINTHEIAINPGGGLWEGGEEMLAIPGLNRRFLHNRVTDFGCVTWTSLGSTPATRRYKVCLWRIGIHGVRHPSASGLLSLTILNSMAGSSITT